MATDPPVLECKDLCVDITVDSGVHRALDGISLQLRQGDAHGLVGESGSGKSLTLRSILGLLPRNARIASGEVLFEGRDILRGDRGGYVESIRGTGISMVFQEPAIALNPIATVGSQISDVLRDRDGLSRSAARERAIEMLDRVGIVDPEQRADAYPFQLSGGMRQRVMIAAAVVCGPRVLLCDEPTTALDVTIQASIISLFKELQREEGISLLYVTHDLAVVAELCSSLTVLYAGRIMEQGDLGAVFAEPASPYTAALLDSTPVVDGPVERLLAIPGSAPTFAERTSGCPFAPRCAFARESCRSASMTLHPARAGLKTACIRVDEHASVIRDATAGAVL